MRNWREDRQTRVSRRHQPVQAVIARRPSAVTRSVGSGFVSDTTNRHDDLGVLGVVLDLAAQPLDVDVDETGVPGMAVSPDLLEEGLAGEHLPRLAGEGDEKVLTANIQVKNLSKDMPSSDTTAVTWEVESETFIVTAKMLPTGDVSYSWQAAEITGPDSTGETTGSLFRS